VPRPRLDTGRPAGLPDAALHDTARHEPLERLRMRVLPGGNEPSDRPPPPIADRDGFAAHDGAQVRAQVRAQLPNTHGSLGSRHVVTVTSVS
jgi:hypothetical protein